MRRRQPASSRGDTFFSPATPRVFAHRGLAVDAPENTPLSFLKALSVGVIYLETDVHASKDGVAVISHDADLARVAGRAARVDELSFAELTAIDLGNGQTFASLAEVLAAFPDARFNVDIKCSGAIPGTVEAVLNAAATHRVLIASFDDRRRRAAVRQLPGVATSASRVTSVAALITAKLGLRMLLARVLRDVDAVQLPERIRGFRIVTPSMVRMLHAAGVEIHVWTINDVATMTRLLGIGVDGIVTDRADLAMELVGKLR